MLFFFDCLNWQFKLMIRKKDEWKWVKKWLPVVSVGVLYGCTHIAVWLYMGSITSLNKTMTLGTYIVKLIAVMWLFWLVLFFKKMRRNNVFDTNVIT